jgi:protein-disulfide isomerase
VIGLSRIGHLLSRICLLFSLALGYSGHVRAQEKPPTSESVSAQGTLIVNRRIEVLIRSQFPIPPDCEVSIGDRSPSNMVGYDDLPVTFTAGGKKVTSNFLISKDGKTLARLQKFDLTNNPALSIDVDKRPIRGNVAAPVEIINFDDLECPFCALMNTELAHETLDHYKGLVKIVYKDYPIEEIHPWATHAAVNANCLAVLSTPAYWAYVDYVHSNAQTITGENPDTAKSFITLDSVTTVIGAEHNVDGPKLAACIKSQDHSVVESSVKLGASLDLDGTPQVFVGGERLPSGARPVDELWPAIDRALKAQGITPPPENLPPAVADSGKAAPTSDQDKPN